jgi:2,4-dienoyl-CoA reductase-like NADH-dependent reductase (Old Yellow Enzyme family)
VTGGPSLVFQPGRIGSLDLPNRLVMPPMLMGYGSADGYVTERAKDYYGARAAGGVGLVIVEASMPLPAGKMFPYYLDCSDDRYLPGLTELAGEIKRSGARAAIQIGDGGRETRFELTGRHPAGPSPVAARKRERPKEMTIADIEAAVAGFAAAVARVRTAGFDGVEIHAAHVYLLAQFLSGSTNFRRDAYGGSTENRARIVTEIAAAARALVGPDYPLWLRINGQEYDTEGGVTLEEAALISRLAEDAGYDAISVSAGSPHYDATIQSMYADRGALVPLAERIKQAVSIPVIVTGRLDPDLGDEILRRGQADFIAIGRALLADPELPAKALAGRAADVTPCVAALNCVNRGVLRDAPITCLVNPALGLEREYRIEPAAEPRTVAVAGAGPAGLEAARVAAARGHRVVVFERDPEPGGQLLLGSRAPGKDTLAEYLDYLLRQLSAAGVILRSGEEATVASIAAAGADAVILATGSGAPRITGRVAAGPPPGDIQPTVGTVDDVLRGDLTAGRNVLIAGGTGRCCEVADLLTETGASVTLVTSGRKVAPEVVGLVRGVLLRRLAEKKVVTRTGVWLGAITPAGAEIHGPGLNREPVAADTVLLSERAAADVVLASSLRAAGIEVHLAGDCAEQGELVDAVASGARAGRLV